MIYHLNQIIPCDIAGTQLPDGTWVRAMHNPFFGGVVSRTLDAIAVLRGKAFAFYWPKSGEFEAAISAPMGERKLSLEHQDNLSTSGQSSTGAPMTSTSRIAPIDAIWICSACGKTHTDRYGIDGEGSHGWDESCMMHAVLCKRGNIKPGDRVTYAELYTVKTQQQCGWGAKCDGDER